MRNLVVVCSIVSCICGVVSAEDWPQYQGPGQTGVSNEAGLLRTWAKSEPKLLWKSPIGLGYGARQFAMEKSTDWTA